MTRATREQVGDNMVMIDPDYRESDDDRTARLIESMANVVTDAEGIVIARDDAVFLAGRWLDMQARERQLVEERDAYRQRLIRIEGWALQVSELMDRIRWTKNYDGATDQEDTDG
jgi:hypothetical protein